MIISYQQSRLAKWYFTFFVIIVLGFAALTFIHLLNNEWENFHFGVTLLGSELYEELTNYRNTLKVEDADSLNWTKEMLDQFHNEVDQEIIDETIDNKLSDFGYARIRNLLSGRTLYESPEIKELNLELIEQNSEQWGYKPIQFICLNNKVEGVGYWGERINTHYFVATIFKNGIPVRSDCDYSEYRHIAYQVVDSIKRNAFDLYIKQRVILEDFLERQNAWAYVYIVEKDSILWASAECKKQELYFPKEFPEKNYFADIQDIRGGKYKQYTLIHDKIPNYIYVVDVAVPKKSVHRSILITGLFIFLGAAFLIVITWASGKFFTRRALKPVDEVIDLVDDITSKNLDIRLPIPGTDDEIARLVKTLNDLLDRLSKAFLLHKSFIADASHELRTPLSILVGEIEMASKNIVNNPVAQKNLKEAAMEIENMARIVDDLQLLARWDAGQLHMEKKNIRLDEVLMNTLSRCQILSGKFDIKLNVDIIEALEYIGDEKLLTRALGNLVNNAIKYSNPGGIVKLSLAKNSQFIIFKVSDNGIGIPKESLGKIFDRFYRVDVSRSRETGGSGLGLSITKQIINLHHGELTVESKVSHGSTFTIKLPK